YDEEDDCNGTSGVEVEVTDADGSSWTMTTNQAGNFYLASNQASPVYPITAVIRYNGLERAMVSGQSSGDCASCHTVAGSGGAPGRIVLPE
ncbi:MAG: hypothetical protein KC656_32350, partial [Myxococcales bacterium]|nr:hypothetical protein [Myxococcales bacterium]